MTAQITAEFDDNDQFVEQLKLWGWEGSIRQTESGQFGARLELHKVDGMTALRAHHRIGNLREVLTPADARTFGLVVPASNSNTWCSKSFDQVILQMMPTGDYVATNSGSHQGYQFVFSNDLIARTLEALEIQTDLDLDACRIELNSDQAAGFQPLFDRLWTNTNEHSAGLTAEAVLSAFLLAFSSAPARSRSSIRGRTLVVQRAREFIDANLEEPLTLADIGRAAAASKRTLTAAFQDQLGISPIQYLKLTRLNRAHSTLRRSATGTVRVSDIANLFGFWHMGQFASDYRSLFGELPSESLSRQ